MIESNKERKKESKKPRKETKQKEVSHGFGKKERNELKRKDN